MIPLAFEIQENILTVSYSYIHRVMMLQEFLNSEMTVPTVSGLPLKLKVKGTTSVDLKASGKMDLRKVSTSPRSLVVDGELRPRSVMTCVSCPGNIHR